MYRHLLLLLSSFFLCAGCNGYYSSHPLGTDGALLCTSPTTGVSLRCVDAVTGESLGGQTFQIWEKESVYSSWGGPLTIALDTLYSDAAGMASLEFKHRPEGYMYYLTFVPRNGWYCMATYDIPQGCLTEYVPELKKAVPMTLVVKNIGSSDFALINFAVNTLPPNKRIDGLYNPATGTINQLVHTIGPLPAGASDTLMVQVLPQERNVIALLQSSPSSPFYAQDTIYPNSAPEAHTILIRK